MASHSFISPITTKRLLLAAFALSRFAIYSPCLKVAAFSHPKASFCRHRALRIPVEAAMATAAAATASATRTLHHQQRYRSDRSPGISLSSLSSTPTNVGEKDTLDGIADDIIRRISIEWKELVECTSLVWNYLSKPERDVSAEDVVLACDAVDAISNFDETNEVNSANDAHSTMKSVEDSESESYLNKYLALRRNSHKFGRYHLLVKLLKSDYDAYVQTASFLSPSRIDRLDLPNVQDVPYIASTVASASSESPISNKSTEIIGEDGQPLVPDCTLQDLSYDESPLDKLLLSLFRKLVTKNTGGIQNDIPGIKGLLDQGRQFMLREGQTAEAQHEMVKDTLGGLMTPVLPPFYRIFMSGIVPELGTPFDKKQFGPWPYAPYLTSIVTPTFFSFLVGPSYPNRRSDGKRGGLLVEKCKFLQESGCKGLCLHQCKIPAQEFFGERLGLDLTVIPNFETQECQWSFGERPLPPEEDPSFPRGCLVGCESRKAMAGRKSNALCM